MSQAGVAPFDRALRPERMHISTIFVRGPETVLVAAALLVGACATQAGNSSGFPGGGAAGPDQGGATPDADASAPPADGGSSVDGPAKPCAFTFCEDFESYGEGEAPGRGVWVGGHPSLVVDAVHVARGQRALHVPPTTKGPRFIRTTKPFPALGQRHYGRLFLWIEQEPVEKPATVYHWTVAEASERAQGGARVLRSVGGLQRGAGNNQLLFNVETHDGTPTHEAARTDRESRVATRRWHCLEWFLNKEKNEFRFWWDGQERPGLTWPAPDSNDPKYTSPQYFFPEMKSFSIGLAEYQQTITPWEVWIDEVVLHGERIGCDP